MIDTKEMITTLLGNKPDAFPVGLIEKVHMDYRHHLRKGHIIIVGNKLMLCKLVNMDTKYIGPIVTTDPLCRIIFDRFYLSTSGSHMDTYNNLFCLKMMVF